MTSPFRFVLTVVLLAVIAVRAFAQVPIPNDIGSGIGPSGAQVAGAIAGVAGITGLVLYLTLREPSIAGCIQSVNGISSLTNEKDKRTYILEDERLLLRASERVQLKGKKIKQKDGRFAFRVEKLDRDYGPCSK